MTKQIDRIESFRRLEAGWREGGGEKITDLAIDRAKEFSRMINETSPSVFPREDGGVGFEWATPTGYASVEFFPKDDDPDLLHGEVFVLESEER